jgi:hypothetical protein
LLLRFWRALFHQIPGGLAAAGYDLLLVTAGYVETARKGCESALNKYFWWYR